MNKTVTMRKLKSILPILIGVFVVTGFICLPTPQRFIEDVGDDRSHWIDRSDSDSVASGIKSPVFSMPSLMAEPRPLTKQQTIVCTPTPEDPLVLIARFYRHVLVARAP